MSLIYVLRHGQSIANENPSLYGSRPNEEFTITSKGQLQAVAAGRLIKTHLNSRSTEVAAKDNVVRTIAIHSSPYLRCVETANLVSSGLECKRQARPNLLLSEMNFGDQEGCSVEDFSQRHIERYHKEKSGTMQYSTQRGENFVDVHARMGLFVVQQQFFDYCPVNIIVTHASPALMLHYFLIQSCPKGEIDLKAEEYWPNSLVRVYNRTGINIRYEGILQDEENMVKDVFK